MSHELRDPAKEPKSPLFEPASKDMEDYDPMNIGGPGGTSTLTENDEAGILESGLFRVIAKGTRASLQAERHKVGIYAEGNTD